MNLTSLTTDNISEVLFKIIEFTKTRRELLTKNINNARTPGFIPKDLTADEFSVLINKALDEHIANQRLLLLDTENIKFGASGTFEVKPVTDKYAQKLLRENPDQYLQLQINKLLENSLNQKIATELLKQKQGLTSILDNY